jgi:hypothetical protein
LDEPTLCVLDALSVRDAQFAQNLLILRALRTASLKYDAFAAAPHTDQPVRSVTGQIRATVEGKFHLFVGKDRQHLVEGLGKRVGWYTTAGLDHVRNVAGLQQAEVYASLHDALVVPT